VICRRTIFEAENSALSSTLFSNRRMLRECRVSDWNQT
jgi:hypothetical protein